MSEFIKFLKSDAPQICVEGGCAPFGKTIVVVIGLVLVFIIHKIIFKK